MKWIWLEIVVVVIALTTDCCISWRHRRANLQPPPAETDCQVSDWSQWTTCLPKCQHGHRSRSRTITVQPSFFGAGCPGLADDEDCGGYNGDCDHGCDRNTGNCLCDSGYELIGNHWCEDIDECQTNNGNCSQRCRNNDGGFRCKCFRDHHQLQNGTCVPDDCQAPPLPHCPGNAYHDAFGSVCQKVTAHCPHGTVTDEQCQLSCGVGFSLALILPGSNSGMFGQRYLDAQFNGLIRSITCNELTYHDIVPGWTRASDLVNYYCRRRNDPPNAISLSHHSITEQTAVDSIIGALAATDIQSGQTVSFTVISSTVGSHFDVINGALVNKWVPVWYPVQSATGNTYTVTIRATDSGQPAMWIEQDFVITVINTNDPPTAVQLSSNSVQASSVVNTVVGVLSAVDSDGPSGSSRSSSFTWQLLNDDQGRFALQSSSQLIVAGVLSGVTGTIRQVTVRCSDSHPSNPKSTDTVIYITVLGSNMPTAGLTITPVVLPETAAPGQLAANVVLVVSGIGGTVTFNMSASAAVTTGAFALDQVSCVSRSNQRTCSAELKTTTGLNFEVISSYPLSITASVASTQVALKTATLSVLDVNEAPSGISLVSSDINENSMVGTVVGRINVADADVWQSHNCTMQGRSNDVPFIVNGMFVVVRSGAVLDYETQSLYSFVLSCSDNGVPMQSVTAVVNVTVVDVNEPPSSLLLTNRFIREDSPLLTVVGIFIANDPDQTPGGLSITLQGTSNLFSVGGASNAELLVKGQLDHETKPFANIVIRVTDNGGLFMEKTFTIEIIGVNERPTDIYLTDAEMRENTPPNVLVSPIVVVDPDTNLGASCSLHVSTPYFKVQGVNLLAGDTTVDYESLPLSKSLEIELTCQDQDGLTFTKKLMLNVTDANEQPSNITLQEFPFDESSIGIVVGVISVTDPDLGQRHNCSLPGNQTASQFVRVQGMKIHLVMQVNFEEFHHLPLTIHCYDRPTDLQQRLGTSRDFSLSVTDVNERPESPCHGDVYVSEDATNNTMVHVFVSHDPDNEEYEIMKSRGMPPATWFIKQRLTYTLVDGTSPNLPFKLLDDGILITQQSLNVSAQSSYDLKMKVTDDGKLLRLPNNRPLLVDSTPLDNVMLCALKIVASSDPRLSTGIRLSSTNVRENSPAKTFIGQLSTTISQFDELFVFAIIGSAADPPFEILNDKLMVSGKRAIDFEKSQIIGVGVSATGNKGTTLRKYFDINVQDVNEAAVKLCLVPDSVPEYSPVGTVVGRLVVEDPDFPSSINACAHQSTSDAAGRTYACSFNANSDKILQHLQSMFVLQSGNVLVTNRSFIRSDAMSYTLPIICRESADASKYIEDVLPVKITASSCPSGKRPSARGCICVDPLQGPKCDRNPTLCSNSVCSSQEVCSVLIHSQKRCMETRFQLPLLLRLPFSRTSAAGYMYALEAYVEDILRGVGTKAKLADVKGRSRRSLPNVYVEGTTSVDVKGMYTYVVLVAMDSSQQYTPLPASGVCRLFAGSDLRCVNAEDCAILKEVGIECPYTYTTGNTGQLGNNGDDDSSSSPTMYIIIALAALVVLLCVAFAILYRRRNLSVNHVSVVYRPALEAPAQHQSLGGSDARPMQPIMASNSMYDSDVKKNELSDINNPTYAQPSDFGIIPSHRYMEPPPAYDERPMQWNGAAAIVRGGEQHVDLNRDAGDSEVRYQDLDMFRKATADSKDSSTFA